MKTTAFNVTVRRIATGCDYHLRLFAINGDVAETRAKDHARRDCGISLVKLGELHAKGIGVFRVVSCEVSPDQSRPNWN
jgi:hypothetical protein